VTRTHFQNFGVRDSVRADSAALEVLYPAAFPDEDLLPLLRELLPDLEVTTSLVGVIDSCIVAHVVFTRCFLEGSNTGVTLLAPLAVAPEWQRQGVGTSLVRAGLERMHAMDVGLVCVLGDPAYYSRLGFVPESEIDPPYQLPSEWQGAWQSQTLGDRAKPGAGKLSVPRQWQASSLWLP
jgi:putative acetyltransferase